MLLFIFFSAAAGIIGTGIGGLTGILWSGKSDRAVNLLLSFAGGVMISVVCFDLLPQAADLGGAWLALIGLIIGILVVMILSDLTDHVSQISHHTPNNQMIKTGTIMLFAMALHNFPEGMAIGSGGMHSTRLGLTLALTIALHDLPEGMAVSLPLSAGGMSKKRALTLTFFSGCVTLFGGIIGVALGCISPVVISTCIATAGGAMLYVTYREILPQVLLYKSKLPALGILAGMIAGFILAHILDG